MGGSSLGAEVLRQSFASLAGFSAAACARLDAPRSGQVVRGGDRSAKRLGGGGQQVRLDGRTQPPAELLSGALHRRAGRERPGALSRRSRIPAPRSTSWRASSGFSPWCPGSRRSADDSRRSRRSAWCRRRSWGWTCRATWNAPPRSRPTAGRRRSGRTPASPSASRLASRRRPDRDKLTLVLAPEIAALGAWLEQLIAESTGKLGQMILPIDSELLAPPNWYGKDRLFVVVRYAGRLADEQEDAVAVAPLRRAAGHRDRLRGPGVAGRRVLPLGVRDRGRGGLPRPASVRPAGRRSGEGRGAQADRRRSRRPARCPPKPRSTPSTASSSSPIPTKPRRSSSPPTNGRSAACSPPTSTAPGPATTSRCAPSSR